jgi:hypothetical protein
MDDETVFTFANLFGPSEPAPHLRIDDSAFVLVWLLILSS